MTQRTCTGCRIAKKLEFAGVVCGIFLWKGWFCRVCHDMVFENRVHSYGFRLTYPFFTGDVILLSPLPHETYHESTS